MGKSLPITMLCFIAIAVPVHSQSLEIAPCPAGAETELWIIAGQSNTHCGRITESMTEPHPGIWMLNMDGAWMPAAEPLHRFYATDDPSIKEPFLEIYGQFGFDEQRFQKNRATLQEKPASAEVLGGGFGLPFAIKLQQTINKPIGLIPCGLGGSAMRHWDPSPKDQANGLYHFMIKQARRSGGKIRGVLWYQGESDAGNPELAGEYESKMRYFIDSVRRDLEQPELPFLLVQIGRYCTVQRDSLRQGWDIIQDTQRRLAGCVKNVYVTTAVDLPLDDPIHVASEGHQVLGERLFQLAMTYVYQSPGYARQILPESIEKLEASQVTNSPCTGGTHVWRLTFSGVSGTLSAKPFMTGFSVSQPDNTDKKVVLYRVQADPDNSAAVLLFVQAHKGIDPALKLSYASGTHTFVNVADELNMAVPAFGPVPMPVQGKISLIAVSRTLPTP